MQHELNNKIKKRKRSLLGYLAIESVCVSFNYLGRREEVASIIGEQSVNE